MTADGAPRRLIAALCGLGAVHLALGVLLPEWQFTKYPDAAALLRSGRLLAEDSADFSPLYLWLNVVLSPVPLRWLQSGVGASAVVATGLLAARMFGPKAGTLSAALLAAAPAMLVYEATLEPDLLIAAASAWALVQLDRHFDAAKPPDDLGSAAWGGLLVGVATATRPTALAFLAAVTLAALVFPRARPPRARLRGAAVFVVVGLVFGFAPAVLLKRAVGGQVSATMSAGQVLFHGNRPESSGAGAQPQLLLKSLEGQSLSSEHPDYAHALWRRFARHAAESGLSASAAETYWAERVFAFAARHPFAVAALALRKAEHLFFGPDTHDIVAARRAQARLEALPLPRTEWLFALGLAGLVASLVVERRARIAALYVVCMAALAVVFYVTGRYRLSLLPPLCSFAGALLALAFSGRRAALAASLATALALFFLQLPAVRDTRRILERVADAGLERRRPEAPGEPPFARFIAATAAFPYGRWMTDLRGVPFEDPALLSAAAARAYERYGVDHPVDALFAAELLAGAGRCRDALAVLAPLGDRSVRWAIFDRLVDAPLLEARCRRSLGAPSEAVAAIRRSLAARPGTAEALSQLLAAAAAGAPADDGEAVREELFALHDPLTARFALATAYNDWSLPDRALAEADLVLAALPESALAHAERARALAALGRHLPAARAFMQAQGLLPPHPFPVAHLDETVRVLLESVDAGAPDPNVLLFASEHAYRRGDAPLALARLEAALPRLPPELAGGLRERRSQLERAVRR